MNKLGPGLPLGMQAHGLRVHFLIWCQIKVDFNPQKSWIHSNSSHHQLLTSTVPMFQQWKQRFDLFLKATSCDGKGGDVKVAILLTTLEGRGLDIYNNMHFAPAQGEVGQPNFVAAESNVNYETVIRNFDEYCNKRDPVMALRAQFWAYHRPEGQGLDEFVNDLRTMSANCKFTEVDSTIRDKLFFSITDPVMKMKVMGDDGKLMQL